MDGEYHENSNNKGPWAQTGPCQPQPDPHAPAQLSACPRDRPTLALWPKEIPYLQGPDFPV